MMDPNKSPSQTHRSLPPKRTPSFPMKLLAMLNDAEQCGFDDVVSWLPDGRTFKIHDEEQIAHVLPRYFKQTRYKSFVRQLQIYSVERTCRGPRKGECKHPLFFRGQSESVVLNRPIEDFQMKNVNNHDHDHMHGTITNTKKEPRSSSKSSIDIVSSKSKQRNRSPTSIRRSISISDDEDMGKILGGRNLRLIDVNNHRRPSIGEISLEVTDLRGISDMANATFVEEHDNNNNDEDDEVLDVGVFDPLPYKNSTTEERKQQQLQLETLVKSFIDDGGFNSILTEEFGHDEDEIGCVSDDDSNSDGDGYGNQLNHSLSFTSLSDDRSSDESVASRSTIRESDLISDEYMDNLLLDLA